MAITEKISAATVVTGKWICGESKLIDGICEPARQVLRVSGQRVYFTNRDGEESHRLLKTVRFVCDSQAEGDKLNALGWEQVKALRELRATYEAKVAAIVAA